ncbi:MAG: hypothetical protein GX596_07160 [Propionibacterium sp.]|nr:hypothetical protein [Propionibacterium sp.]
MNMFSQVLLTARDPELIEAVEALALALGVHTRLVQDSDELAASWSQAPLRLVAPDMASRAAWLGHQPATVLVGRDAAALAAASAELGYSVVQLPDASSRLADVLSAAMTASDAQAWTIAVVGASGGLGASTCAVGLGAAAAQRGKQTSVVELAPRGAGLDLLVGAEATEGVRWSDLLDTRGEFGDVHDSLVQVDGMGLLALSREQPGLPGPAARKSVLGALGRAMDVIVIDAGSDATVEADELLFVVGADVRSVASARVLAAESGRIPTALVVRSGPGRGLSPQVVADSLGARLGGHLRQDPALPRLADLGQPPHSAPARKFRRDVARLWEGVAHG